MTFNLNYKDVKQTVIYYNGIRKFELVNILCKDSVKEMKILLLNLDEALRRWSIVIY